MKPHPYPAAMLRVVPAPQTPHTTDAWICPLVVLGRGQSSGAITLSERLKLVSAGSRLPDPIFCATDALLGWFQILTQSRLFRWIAGDTLKATYPPATLHMLHGGRPFLYAETLRPRFKNKSTRLQSSRSCPNLASLSCSLANERPITRPDAPVTCSARHDRKRSH